jgi:hypothetical protein
MFYFCREPLNLPDTTPTQENIRAARRLLDNFLVDFPFANEASKAHALAFMLLPFVREMIEGPTPLHLFDAPKAGTGKSLLMGILSNVFIPYGAAMQTAPKEEDEWRKRLTTNFRDGQSHLLFDNIRELSSENLQAALTAPDCYWRDRLLGYNESLSLPIRCVWAATCNNISGTIEQLRRCVEIRLDARTDRPEERTEFRHPEIRRWLRQRRPKVVGAALTIIRAWVEAGKPGYSGTNPPMGSFEDWTRVMGGILETVGISGFLDNRQDFTEQADGESQTIREFAHEWFTIHGTQQVSANDLLPIARRYFEDRLGEGSERSQAIRLGKLLAHHRDWVLEERRLTVTPTPNGSRYSLRP